MEEERRLFYVAVTRARRNLYLSSYRARGLLPAEGQSSFLQDIDPSLLTMVGNSYIGRPGASQGVLEKTEFALGDRVIHKGFGRGKIVGINEKSLTYEVDFEQLEGTRRILFRAKMTRADQEQSGNLE
jgi:DNA helicase-2/ATP-dependent DNA helicase PcrA